MMLARNKLGPLELEVMQAVWELKTATVREVYKAYYEGGTRRRAKHGSVHHEKPGAQRVFET